LRRESRSASFPLALLGAFLLCWLVLAVAPRYRQDWLLENILVFIAVPALIWGYRSLRLSNTAYTGLFLFLVLHQVGAHYTYSEVPYDHCWQLLTGQSLNEALGLQRNHYDRLVHFLYGLLITPAAIELLDARAPQQGLWRWLLPWLFMVSHGSLYELIEAGAAGVFGGDLGQAYLGTQGDQWDAAKDSALAALGAAIAVAFIRLKQTIAA
jgi:putative membrane protein